MAGLTREIRGLGQALVDVLRAELAALERDLARSGGELSKGLGLFGAAAALAFWAIGALVVAAIAGLAVWLPLWGAALLVAVLFAAAAVGLALGGRGRIARFENPMATARRRFEDLMDWVQGRLLATEEPVVPAVADAQEDDL
ncbi:MAG TPA: phage holin family protein [Thermoanaerobaculia bacterium]|nr:phage holin family protein [Thermoanaerobaculia bacterium]